jgi:hypothetical protein
MKPAAFIGGRVLSGTELPERRIYYLDRVPRMNGKADGV